ncbi:hypothetical protein Q8F55_009049 [Vanrija albida]|uniref:Uncharacterized protein n=1 Tax=Vanrija albida TaxID=181172 RepID=A0ABR3PSI6_9TREE
METPNTRSRRKRELELLGSQEEKSTVVWGQDDQLLREFMADASDNAIPLPSPTQKPRPLRPSSSTASAHPRKRPCRVSRAASNPPAHLAAGSHRNTPPVDDDQGKRLDALLDRFLDLSSRPASSSSSATLSSRSTSSIPTPSTSSARVTVRQPMTERSTNHRPPPLAATRSLSPTKAKTTAPVPDRRTTSVDSVKPPPTSQARFRPPLLSSAAGVRPQGVRSSPRRAASLNPYSSSSSSTRGPAQAQGALPRVNISSGMPGRPGVKRGSASPTKQPAARIGLTTRQSTVKTAPTRQASAPPPPTTVRQAPEPHASSDGDTSIDSLDILFEGGGEEIDNLLRAVDGQT